MYQVWLSLEVWKSLDEKISDVDTTLVLKSKAKSVAEAAYQTCVELCDLEHEAEKKQRRSDGEQKIQDEKDEAILLALIEPDEVQNFWDWLESEWMDCFAAQTLQESLTKLGYDSIEEAVERFQSRN